MLDINQFREHIVLPALHDLQLYTKELAELLVFTCAVESAGGTYVKQINGPAVGIYQIEPNTLTDLWVNCIVRNPSYMNLLCMNFNLHKAPMPVDLITNMKLASAICALTYKRHRNINITMDVDCLWDLYKKYYNTHLGKAEKEPSIKAYKKFAKV